MSAASQLPERPQLRPVEVSRISHEGSDFFLLRDPRQMSEQTLLVPVPLGPYLQLVDGQHTVDEIVGAAVGNGAGLVPREVVTELLGRLNEVLLLSNGAFANEMSIRLAEYREAPFREPTLAGRAYPSNADELRAYLDGFAFPYSNGLGFDGSAQPTASNESLKSGELTAVISPHIDFERGGDTYGLIWEQVRDELQEAELVVVFGTDHNGDGPRLTLTRQDYTSPLGTMETDKEIVGDLAEILSRDDSIGDHPFQDELNHAAEHSIELATVWLQRALGESGPSVKLLPVLCGSLGRLLVKGVPGPDAHDHIRQAIEYLQQVASVRKTVFVAAADFAHVGPAFGDPEPVMTEDRERVQSDDHELLSAIVKGDRQQFFELVKTNSDVNKICGLAPIYMTLWAAEAKSGNWNGYRQCPADENETSFVSIAGAALYR